MPDIRLQPLGNVGLNSDVGASVLDMTAVTSLHNVETHEGALKSSRGEIKLFDLAIEPLYHYAHVDISGFQWLVVTDGVKVHAYQMDGAMEDITPEGGDLSYGVCTISDLNGVLIFNSDQDGLYYWPGSGDKLTQWPGPGDDQRSWFLDEQNPPLEADGEDGDYWHDVYLDEWYMKSDGSWTTSTDGVEYGWRWDLYWRCAAVESYRYFVVALAMVESNVQLPYKVRWSTAGEEGTIPVQWVPRAENEAGSDLLGETEGRIIGGSKVRDALFVIKEDAVYTCQWIGGEYVMQFSRLQGTIGTNILGGFSEVAGNLAIFTSTDLLVFTGSENNSITDNRVRNALFENMDESYWDKSTIYYHQPTGILYAAFVSAGNEALTECLLYNSFDNSWGHKKLHAGYGFDTALVTLSTNRVTYDSLDADGMMTVCNFNPVTLEATTCTEMPIPGWEAPPVPEPASPRWEGQTGKTYDELINFSYNKGVYQPSVPDTVIYESNLNDPEVTTVGRKYWVSLLALSHINSDGTPKECWAERVGLPIEKAKGRFVVNEAWVEAAGDGEFYLDVGVSDTPNGTVHWSSQRLEGEEFGMLVDPSVDAPLDPSVEGRYLAWRLYSRTSGSWQLQGLTFNWEASGAH